MKNFNPDKELNKIKYGKRNKMIFTIIFSIVLVTIGYSLALYQVRHTKRIIYTTISDFKDNKDIDLVLYVNGEKTQIPPQEEKYKLVQVSCDTPYEGKATWDFTKKLLSLPPISIPNKCSVYFSDIINNYAFTGQAVTYTAEYTGIYILAYID